MHLLVGKAGHLFALFFRNKRILDALLLLPFVWLSLKIRLQYVHFLASPGQSLPTSDDSKWYLQYAYTLIAEKKIGLHMNDIMYMGYNVLLAGLLAVFREPVMVLYIQAAIAGLCVVLVYEIARMLFNRITAVIAAYLYCYYAWSITLWASYILADSLFVSLLLLTVFLLIKSKETGKRAYRISFIASAIYLALFKPTGLMVVAVIGLYLLINLHKQVIVNVWRRRRLPILLGTGGVLLIGVLLLASGRLDPLLASMQFNAKMVLYNIYAKGWIYDSPSPFDIRYRPDYTIDVMNSLIVSFFVHNWDAIGSLYIKRAIAFLGRWVWQIDLTSRVGIVGFVKNMLPVLLFGVGMLGALVGGVFRKASLIWMIVLVILLYCVVFFIDGMYRYRAPATPFILIAVAYGAERMLSFVWHSIRTVLNRLRSASGGGTRDAVDRDGGKTSSSTTAT